MSEGYFEVLLYYRGLGLAVSGGVYGSGSGVIWLDNVECLGQESDIAECERSEWASHNCDHSEDAGVICTDTLPPTPTPPHTTRPRE